MPINRPLEALDALALKGSLDCSGNPDYPAASAGHVYRVSADGRIGGATGPLVFVGDLLICAVDASASGDHATVGANWSLPASGNSVIVAATYADLANPASSVNTGPKTAFRTQRRDEKGRVWMWIEGVAGIAHNANGWRPQDDQSGQSDLIIA